MLALPAKGLARSVNRHNVDLSICCDWIEACALFSGGEATGSDIVDILRENEIYASQDFAWALVNNVFAMIRERGRVLGLGYPIRVRDGTRVVAEGDWDAYAAYAFCLTLSLSKAYPEWWRAFGVDYGPQGLHFEDLTAEPSLDLYETATARVQVNRASGLQLAVSDQGVRVEDVNHLPYLNVAVSVATGSTVELKTTGDPRLIDDGKFYETPPMSGPVNDGPTPAKKKGR